MSLKIRIQAEFHGSEQAKHINGREQGVHKAEEGIIRLLQAQISAEEGTCSRKNTYVWEEVSVGDVMLFSNDQTSIAQSGPQGLRNNVNDTNEV